MTGEVTGPPDDMSPAEDGAERVINALRKARQELDQEVGPVSDETVERVMGIVRALDEDQAWTLHETATEGNPRDYAASPNPGYDPEGYPYQQ